MKKTILILVLTSGLSFAFSQAENRPTVEAITNHGKFYYHLDNSGNVDVIDNLITFGDKGNAVAETGQCKNNYYRPIKPDETAPFDTYKY